MLAERLSLILSREWIAADDSPDGRLAVKVLAASVLRNLPGAELKVVRAVAVAEDWKPLFRVERAGLEERGTRRETSRGPWEALACVGEVEHYPWVLFLDSGSLLLRGVDHLLTAEADLLWAPLPGVPVAAERSGIFLRSEEREAGYEPERPHSRPWKEAASAAVWAVRGEHLRAVMAQWAAITCSATTPEVLPHVQQGDGSCCGGEHGNRGRKSG